MQKITPCLSFDDQAEEAVNFYTSVFKNSKIEKTTYYEGVVAEKLGIPAGSVMMIKFTLDGQEYLALNGPEFEYTGAISLMVDCDTQEEVDYFWEKLSADGGEEIQCGWLKDKFGVRWQVVPRMLMELQMNSDKATIERVMLAMMKMVKLDIATLEAAAKATAVR